VLRIRSGSPKQPTFFPVVNEDGSTVSLYGVVSGQVHNDLVKLPFVTSAYSNFKVFNAHRATIPFPTLSDYTLLQVKEIDVGHVDFYLYCPYVTEYSFQAALWCCDRDANSDVVPIAITGGVFYDSTRSRLMEVGFVGQKKDFVNSIGLRLIGPSKDCDIYVTTTSELEQVYKSIDIGLMQSIKHRAELSVGKLMRSASRPLQEALDKKLLSLETFSELLIGKTEAYAEQHLSEQNATFVQKLAPVLCDFDSIDRYLMMNHQTPDDFINILVKVFQGWELTPPQQRRESQLSNMVGSGVKAPIAHQQLQLLAPPVPTKVHQEETVKPSAQVTADLSFLVGQQSSTGLFETFAMLAPYLGTTVTPDESKLLLQNPNLITFELLQGQNTGRVDFGSWAHRYNNDGFPNAEQSKSISRGQIPIDGTTFDVSTNFSGQIIAKIVKDGWRFRNQEDYLRVFSTLETNITIEVEQKSMDQEEIRESQKRKRIYFTPRGAYENLKNTPGLTYGILYRVALLMMGGAKNAQVALSIALKGQPGSENNPQQKSNVTQAQPTDQPASVAPQPLKKHAHLPYSPPMQNSGLIEEVGLSDSEEDQEPATRTSSQSSKTKAKKKKSAPKKMQKGGGLAFSLPPANFTQQEF